MLERYQKHLDGLLSKGKLRRLPVPQTNLNRKPERIDFSTNDYLSLSRNPKLAEAASKAAAEHGVGSTGSRLLSGNSALAEELEATIARDKGTEAALVFSSGFQANLSALSALLDAKVLGTQPIVFFDKFNHASLYQAIFLAQAELIRYKHNDIAHLTELLNKHGPISRSRPGFIISETIFGMDGDIAPLDQLAALAEEHGCLLYLDEAHATGIFGPDGYGLSTMNDLSNVQHVVMGTFSKALGCSGGYVACSQMIKDYLVNSAAGFIYSTAPSPVMSEVALAGWRMVKNLDHERACLLALGKRLRDQLVDLGFDVGSSASHIVPIILSSEAAAIEAADRLKQAGILVSCVRPPTVRPGTSRLRIALTTQHTEQDVDELVQNLIQICK